MNLGGWSGWADEGWDGWSESASAQDPAQTAEQPTGGWFMRPRRQEEAVPQELESVRTEAGSLVGSPAATAPTHIVIKPLGIAYNDAQVAAIRKEAALAALEELRLLEMKKKKRRDEEILLLM